MKILMIWLATAFVFAQPAAPEKLGCGYTISQTSFSMPAAGGSDVFEITTPDICDWTVTGPSWVSFSPATGSGTGFVFFSVDANTGGPRTGTINVENRSITITQERGGCDYSVNANSFSFPQDGGSDVFQIFAPTGCAWSVSGPSWINFSPASGSGDTFVFFSIDPNTSIPRSGAINVEGILIPVTQEGTACEYTVNPGARVMPAGGGRESFDVSAPAGCDWTATADVGWIAFPGANSGTGDGQVTYDVSANLGGSERVGRISVAGQLHVVTQAPDCDFTLSPVSQGFTPSGGQGAVSVATGVDCSYSLNSNRDWIVLDDAGGAGNQTFTFTILPNDSTQTRSGAITVSGLLVTIQQAGCSFELSSPQTVVNASGGNGQIAITADAVCSWPVSESEGWISLVGANGQGSGPLVFTAVANPFGVERVGLITIGGQVHRVVQKAAAVIQFESQSLVVNERAMSAVIALVRSGNLDEALSVELSVTAPIAQPGQDYEAPPTTVTFPEGVARVETAVTIIEDSTGEDDEILNFQLNNPQPGAILGDLTQTQLTIADIPNPQFLNLQLSHPLYGLRGGNAVFARDDQITLLVNARDNDNDNTTNPIVTVDGAELADFTPDTSGLGAQTLNLTLTDIENNRVTTTLTYDVVDRPTPPAIANTTWNRNRDEPLLESGNPNYYYDLAPLGAPSCFGDEVLPAVHALGSHQFQIYRWSGDRNNPQSLVLSDPVTISLTIATDPNSAYPHRYLLPWFSNNLAGGSREAGDYGFLSSLAVNNPGDETVNVRLSLTRQSPAGADRSRFRRVENHQIAPGSQLFLDATRPGFMESISNPYFAQKNIWSANGPGSAVLIEADQPIINAGFATYSGSRIGLGKPSTASPAQTSIPTLANAARRVVFNTLPNPNNGFVAVVFVNAGQVATPVRIRFYDGEGNAREHLSEPLPPMTPSALLLDANLLSAQGFAIAEAVHDDGLLLGSSFLFNSVQEPAMSGATPFPQADGPTTFYLPWVSYNLAGGSGEQGDYQFRSEITVNNLSQDAVVLQFTGRRGDGTLFQAERSLGPLRHGAWPVETLFQNDSGFGMAVTVESSGPMIGVNYVTDGGRRGVDSKVAERSPAQSNAATPRTTSRRLIFNLVNDADRPEIQPAVVVMNNANEPMHTSFSLHGEAGLIRQINLEQDIQPGSPFAVIFAAEDSAGSPGQFITLAAPSDENFFVVAESDQVMSGSTFLNAPQFLETAVALAPPIKEIRSARLLTQQIVPGDPIEIDTECPTCDGVQVSINGISRISNDVDHMVLDSNEFNVTNNQTYNVVLQPVFDGETGGEITRLELTVDIRLFIPDEGFYQLLGAPETAADLEAITVLQPFNAAEAGVFSIQGMDRLTRLTLIAIEEFYRNDEVTYDLDLSRLERLVVVSLINSEPQRGSGLQRVTLPNTDLLESVTIQGLGDLAQLVFGETDTSIYDLFTTFSVTHCDDLERLDMRRAAFQSFRGFNFSENPSLRCLNMPLARGPGAAMALDLKQTGLTTLDNFGCGGGFSLAGSILTLAVDGDALLLNQTPLSPQGCLQLQTLDQRGVNFLADSCQ